MHVVEGTGLILERDWAGYLTVIATSALVPFECYEIFQKESNLLLKIPVLVVNLGFVVYVVVKLRQERRERRAQRGEPA